MIHLAKSQLAILANRLRLLNAPLIAVGMLIAVAIGTFRLRNNPLRKQHERVGQQLYGSRMRPVHAPQKSTSARTSGQLRKQPLNGTRLAPHAMVNERLLPEIT